MSKQKLGDRLNEVFLGIALGYEVHGIEAMLNEVRALEDERDALLRERESLKENLEAATAPCDECAGRGFYTITADGGVPETRLCVCVPDALEAELAAVKAERDALRAQLAEVRLATLRQVHYLAKDNDGYILAEFIKEFLIDAGVSK